MLRTSVERIYVPLVGPADWPTNVVAGTAKMSLDGTTWVDATVDTASAAPVLLETRLWGTKCFIWCLSSALTIPSDADYIEVYVKVTTTTGESPAVLSGTINMQD